MPTASRSPFDRPRWTEQDARAALAALERSGRPVREFAEEHGLDPQRLYAWRRRLAATSTRRLVARLAHLQRARPRSESLRRLEGQLVLPLGGLMVPIAPKPTPSTGDQKKTRKGRHPGRAAPPDHLQRVPVFNRVPHELRFCPQCGAMMTTVSHSSCLVLNVIPARVFVEERLDETIACPDDDTIVSAAPPPQIVERGKLADALLVEAVCDKFIEHLPIERQCARFATCIAHDVNPRAYLHKVVHCIVHGWPQAKLRDLLPDRMLAAHPELYAGDPVALPIPEVHRPLPT